MSLSSVRASVLLHPTFFLFWLNTSFYLSQFLLSPKLILGLSFLFGIYRSHLSYLGKEESSSECLGNLLQHGKQGSLFPSMGGRCGNLFLEKGLPAFEGKEPMLWDPGLMDNLGSTY